MFASIQEKVSYPLVLFVYINEQFVKSIFEKEDPPYPRPTQTPGYILFLTEVAQVDVFTLGRIRLKTS